MERHERLLERTLSAMNDERSMMHAERGRYLNTINAMADRFVCKIDHAIAHHIDNPTELHYQYHEDDERFWKGSSQRRYERLIAPTGAVVDNSDHLIKTLPGDNGTFDFHNDTQGGPRGGRNCWDTSAWTNLRKKLENACNSKHPDDRHIQVPLQNFAWKLPNFIFICGGRYTYLEHSQFFLNL